MPELLQQAINGNELLVFIVALFFSALSGQKMDLGQRVALLYSYCLAIVYCRALDPSTIAFGSLIVLFLVFEVFSNEKMLVHLFSFKYKCLDFLYRLIFEFHGALFFFALFTSAYMLSAKSIVSHIIFLVLVIALAAMTSKQHFSAKSISRIIKELEVLGGDPVNCVFSSKDYPKLQILIYMEDGNFLDRKETIHIVTARYLMSRVISRLRTNGLARIKRNLSNPSSLRRYIRGYSTIEMQIIRNIGLNIGSHRLKIRRKMFEILYSQAVFNSYIRQLSKKSPARRNIKQWILRCYLRLVSVKVDDTVCYPNKDGSTFRQLLGKEFSDLSEEEFFVWCLGLPHYENGIGERAVKIHIDAVKHFGLDEMKIVKTINGLRNL